MGSTPPRQSTASIRTTPAGSTRTHGSAWRMFRMVDAVSHDGVRLSPIQLGNELGVSRSTAYDMLATLAAEGYVEKIQSLGRFRLGPSIPILYERYLTQRLGMQVDPVLRELAHRVGRSMALAIQDHGATVIVHTVSPPRTPPVGLATGFAGPAHALAVGKILVATGGPRAIHDYLAGHDLEAFTDRTITSARVLETHLKQVAVQGYATERDEFAPNLSSVAVAVRTRSGEVVGALGVSTTTRRLQSEAASLLDAALRGAEAIARQLPP